MFQEADQLHVDEVATSALLQCSHACGLERQWGEACGLRPELCATYAPLPVSEVGRIRPEKQWSDACGHRPVGQIRPELQWSDACGLRPELHATCTLLPQNRFARSAEALHIRQW